MDPKSEKSDTEFPPSGQIGRTEKQLSGFTDIACDQDNPLKRLSQTLHKRNVSDSKILAEKTECAVLPDTEDTETVLNKCSRLLFDIAPRAVDKVLLNKYKGSPGYLLDDLYELNRFSFIFLSPFRSGGFDCLSIEEVLSKKDEYMSVEEIIKEDRETGVEVGLLKIKYYYSWLLCVNKQNLAKTELCFMWNLITKAVVRIGGSEFKTEIENLASLQTCDPFKIPDKHTGITCDQSEIERIQKIFKKIDISDPVSNRQFVVPPGKLFHIYFIHSSDPSDTLLVETTIKTIQNHGFKCCRGLSKIMNEQSFEKTKTDSCVLCLVLTRCFMEEASRECIELLKSQRCKVLVIQVSENKDTDFQFENLTKIDALGFWEEHIEWFQELLKYLKNTDLENVNIIANEKFNCNPSTAFRVKSSITDAEQIDILILTDQLEKPKITKILENRVKITNPKLVSKESDVIVSKSEQVKQLTREQMITAKQIIQANSDQLFKNHRNLNIITSSNVRSKKEGEEIINEPCIVMYCYCKGLIPEDENDFPKFLIWETHKLPIDVREGFFDLGAIYNTGPSTIYHQKIKMGCAMGIQGSELEGSIGPFLKWCGGVGFLTCAHTTCGVHNSNYIYQVQNLDVDLEDDIKVLQPPQWPQEFIQNVNGNIKSHKVGKVVAAVFKPNCDSKAESSIDVGVVKITNKDRIPLKGEFAVSSPSNLREANFKELPLFEGSVIKDPLQIDTDARIVKFGMKTHATRGIITSNGTVVRTNIAGLPSSNQSAYVTTFQNQFEVGSITTCPIFFHGGDSGSGVFQVEKKGNTEILHLIGLAIGYTSYHSAIVTPIQAIMDVLGIDERAFILNEDSC